MLTVLTWLWEQPGCRTTYRAQHVNIWGAMIRRHLTLPHRLACVTDIPEGINSEIEIIRPPGEFLHFHSKRWGREKPSCYRRIAMFRPDAADLFGDRFVQIDLDVVIGASLDPVLDRKEDIVLFRGTSDRRPYNGSMTLMTAGARPHVYTEFTPEGAVEASRRFVGSDQAWMCHSLGPGEATWSEEHGVWWYGSTYFKNRPVEPPPAVLFFPGRTKPWNMPEVDRFVRSNYRSVQTARAA